MRLLQRLIKKSIFRAVFIRYCYSECVILNNGVSMRTHMQMVCIGKCNNVVYILLISKFV